MKIKRYTMKEGIKEKDLLNAGARMGGSWIKETAGLFISKTLDIADGEISVNIGFEKDLTKWDDFDNVLLLDEEFCQPYTPFYGKNYSKDIHNFSFLETVIAKYNEFMDSLPFLVEVVPN